MNHRRYSHRPTGVWSALVLALLACQGVAGLNPFATATPTPTQTSTPTSTPTVTPSPTATATSTLTPTPRPMGMAIQEQEDGRSLVIDYDNHYQFLLPPDWVVVFSTEADLEQAIQGNSKNNPEFAQLAEGFKDVDPDIFRLAALNMDRDSLGAGFPTLLTMNAHTGSVASKMPMSFVTAMIEDTLLEDATSTSWEVVDSSHGVEVGLVRGTKTITIPNQLNATVEELVITFESNKKLIVIEIAAPKKFAEELLTPFDEMIASIQTNMK